MSIMTHNYAERSGQGEKRYNGPMGCRPGTIFIGTMALLLLTACAHGDSSRRAPLRVAVPPVLAPALAPLSEPGQAPLQFVEMHPYARARDLEVLLFSSGSQAFQGVVVPGRSLPSLRPWLTPFSLPLAVEVRPDVVKCLGAPSPLAVPLTVDFAVLVIRRDLWAALALPAPSNLASLREACLILRSKQAAIQSGIESNLPADELFWDLAWSFEGKPDTGLYTFPKVHVLEFMREFRLDRTLADGGTPLEELRSGRSAAVFTSLQKGLRLCIEEPSLAILPLPSSSGRAQALYNGWCLARLSGGGDVERLMSRFAGVQFQSQLAGRGWVPAFSSLAVPAAGRNALERTDLHPSPDFGEGGDEVVLGAILDATQGPMAPEEALRRGAARLRAKEVSP